MVLQRRVLLIDDEEEVRTVTSRVLKYLGYEVTPAEGGDEGITAFKTDGTGFDVVMLDVTMPHPDGNETLAALREMRPEVPVIMMSGYSEEAIADRFATGRPDAFIQKPYDVGTLKETLEQVLRAG